MRLQGIPNVAKLADALGYPRSERVRKVMSGESLPSYGMLEDIARVFASVDVNWLVTGLGAPLKSQPNAPVAGDPPSRYERQPIPKVDPVVITLAPDGQPNIVMLDSRAAAGLPAHYGDPEFFRDKPVFNLPGWKFKGSGMIALQVTGDSMAPTIHHNDWIVARHLANPSEELNEGYVHLLVTKDGAVAKRIFRAADGRHALVCKSDNDDYPSYEVEIGPHDQLYVALGLISEDLSNKGGGVRDRLKQLEKDVQAIQHQLSRRK